MKPPIEVVAELMRWLGRGHPPPMPQGVMLWYQEHPADARDLIGGWAAGFVSAALDIGFTDDQILEIARAEIIMAKAGVAR